MWVKNQVIRWVINSVINLTQSGLGQRTFSPESARGLLKGQRRLSETPFTSVSGACPNDSATSFTSAG